MVSSCFEIVDATPLAELIDGEEQTFAARVTQTDSAGPLSILRAHLRDDAQAIAAVWFNQAWLVDRLEVDQWYIFHGRITRRGSAFSVQNPAFEPWDPEKDGSYGIRPIYPLTEGLSQGVMRRLIQTVIPRLIGQIPEPLPDQIRRRHKLCAVDFAYSRIHHPQAGRGGNCRYRLCLKNFFSCWRIAIASEQMESKFGLCLNSDRNRP